MIQSVWKATKPILGWFLIVIGLIGMPMPIINGTIPLLIGIAMVGHRNWLIRWTRVHIKLFLRWWSARDWPLLGPLGRVARRSAEEISRQHRRMRFWMMDRKHVVLQQQGG
jgi:hypothetical protein